VTKGGFAFIPTLKGGVFPLRPLHPHKIKKRVRAGRYGLRSYIIPA